MPSTWPERCWPGLRETFALKRTPSWLPSMVPRHMHRKVSEVKVVDGFLSILFLDNGLTICCLTGAGQLQSLLFLASVEQMLLPNQTNDKFGGSLPVEQPVKQHVAVSATVDHPDAPHFLDGF